METDVPREYDINTNWKFDIQLKQAQVCEERFAKIVAGATFELKSESWLWERTGNICIEYECRGKPSGIATTQADFWVHELVRDGETVAYVMFPVDRLKKLAREAYKNRKPRIGGDDKASKVVVLKIADLLKQI